MSFDFCYTLLDCVALFIENYFVALAPLFLLCCNFLNLLNGGSEHLKITRKNNSPSW